MSPFEAALWSLVPSVGVMAAAPTGATLTQRVDRAYVIGGGFLLSAAGFGWLTLIRTDSALWYVLTACAVYAAGLVTAMTLANELALGAAPPERAGSAAAVLESGQELGGALGMAILGSIGAAVYTHDMSTASAPAGARETLGAAAAASAPGDALLATARAAFTHGMSWAAAAAATSMAVAALLSVVLLRAARRTAGSPRREPVRVS